MRTIDGTDRPRLASALPDRTKKQDRQRENRHDNAQPSRHGEGALDPLADRRSIADRLFQLQPAWADKIEADIGMRG